MGSLTGTDGGKRGIGGKKHEVRSSCDKRGARAWYVCHACRLYFAALITVRVCAGKFSAALHSKGQHLCGCARYAGSRRDASVCTLNGIRVQPQHSVLQSPDATYRSKTLSTLSESSNIMQSCSSATCAGHNTQTHTPAQNQMRSPLES